MQQFQETITVLGPGRFPNSIQVNNGVETKYYKIGNSMNIAQFQQGASYTVSIGIGPKGGKYINQILGQSGAPTPQPTATLAPPPPLSPIPTPTPPGLQPAATGTFSSPPPLPVAPPNNGGTAVPTTAPVKSYNNGNNVTGKVACKLTEAALQSDLIAGHSPSYEEGVEKVKQVVDHLIAHFQLKGWL